MPEFSKQQKRFLRKLQAHLPQAKPGISDTENFLMRYISFEAQARKLWFYYQCRNRAKKKESHAGIPLIELKKAVVHFDLDIQPDLLDILLDSKRTKRNEKAARELRNPIVHSWKREDCKEVEKRYADFIPAFDQFDKAIRDAV
jgi:hypothetical protein